MNGENRGKTSTFQVYHDVESPEPLTKSKHSYLAAKNNVETNKTAQPGPDVFDFPGAMKKEIDHRMVLGEIQAIHTQNAREKTKMEMHKPDNKFFKHKHVYEAVKVPDFVSEKDVDISEEVVKPPSIWSPLSDDLNASKGIYSPMQLDKSGQDDNIDPDSDIFLASEFTNEIYSHLLKLEVRLRAKANYMSRQPDITKGMRTVVVDWLVEVCEEYKLETETLYLTVSYIDRFLSSMSVIRTKLQLVGTAALFIATKYEEVYPPDIKEFVYITDETYTKRQVLRMENLIMEVLTFDMAVPTAYSFLERLVSIFYSKSTIPEAQRTHSLARYLCELSLLDDTFLCFLPSQIACASFSLAKYTMGQEPWNDTLEDISGYEDISFKGCLIALHEMYLMAPDMRHQTITNKYKSPKHDCVSLITPPPFLYGKPVSRV